VRHSFLLFAALSTLSSAAPDQNAKPELSFEEKLLATLPEKAAVARTYFSADGRSAGYVLREGGKAFLKTGAKTSEPYDDITPFSSPDGTLLGYLGKTGGGCVLVAGDTRSDEVDAVTWLKWGGERQRSLYYVAAKNGKSIAVAGAQKGEEFDLIQNPILSPDGKTLAYVAKQGNQTWVVMGRSKRAGQDPRGIGFNSTGELVAYEEKTATYGVRALHVGRKQGEEFHFTVSEELLQLAAWIFSPTENVVACSGRSTDGRNLYLIVGDQKRSLENTGVILDLQYSPDGRSLAYSSSSSGKDDKVTVTVGNQREESYSSVMFLSFHPDGHSVAYIATEDQKKWFVVAGKRKGEVFDLVEFPRYSPTGKLLVYAASRDHQRLMVINDKAGEPFDKLGDPKFSPDGERVAYRAQKGSGWHVVLGDRLGPEFANVGEPVFSPDSRTIAYPAAKDNQVVMVVGESPMGEFVTALPPTFSPDGRKLAFGARVGQELWWKVCVRGEVSCPRAG
jgi:Tol biopolymer transport system component